MKISIVNSCMLLSDYFDNIARNYQVVVYGDSRGVVKFTKIPLFGSKLSFFVFNNIENILTIHQKSYILYRDTIHNCFRAFEKDNMLRGEEPYVGHLIIRPNHEEID